MPRPRNYTARAFNAKKRAEVRLKARCLTCGSLVNHGAPPDFWHNDEPRYSGIVGVPGGVGMVKLRRRYCNDGCMALAVVVDALKRM